MFILFYFILFYFYFDSFYFFVLKAFIESWLRLGHLHHAGVHLKEVNIIKLRKHNQIASEWTINFSFSYGISFNGQLSLNLFQIMSLLQNLVGKFLYVSRIICPFSRSHHNYWSYKAFSQKMAHFFQILLFNFFYVQLQKPPVQLLKFICS